MCQIFQKETRAQKQSNNLSRSERFSDLPKATQQRRESRKLWASYFNTVLQAVSSPVKWVYW